MSREILLLVDALAHEKSVEREIIFEAVEEALASATASKIISRSTLFSCAKASTNNKISRLI